MGFEQAGHECVYSVEWDKHKRRIYGVIFGAEPEGRDIKDTGAGDFPRSDCWCFGFPCQDISVAGKQLGFDGDRSGLFFEVMRILRETPEGDRPKYLLIENVKNLLSVNLGWDFLALQVALDEVGYDAEWDVLNSKNFGVPQNRERVFVVGHIRGRSTRKIFPIGEINTEFDVPHEQIKNMSLDKNGCFTAIDANYYKGYGVRGNKCRAYVVEGEQLQEIKCVGNMADSDSNYQRKRVYDVCGIAPCLVGNATGGGREPKILTEVRACLTLNRLEKRQNGRRIKEPDEPMFTLTKQDVHGVAIDDCIQRSQSGIRNVGQRYGTLRGNASRTDFGVMSSNMRIRRLTPRECMRLQGVPDEVTDKLIVVGISNTQIYRAAGDACTVPVIYEIARRME